jgi:hypothetical protein
MYKDEHDPKESKPPFPQIEVSVYEISWGRRLREEFRDEFLKPTTLVKIAGGILVGIFVGIFGMLFGVR